LNLVEFTACLMTESGAGSPEIVRRKFVDAGFPRVLPDKCQTTFSVKPLPQTVPARVTRLKIFPFEIPAECSQSSTRSFTPYGPEIRMN
jgi:hypothetical protein